MARYVPEQSITLEMLLKLSFSETNSRPKLLCDSTVSLVASFSLVYCLPYSGAVDLVSSVLPYKDYAKW